MLLLSLAVPLLLVAGPSLLASPVVATTTTLWLLPSFYAVRPVLALVALLAGPSLHDAAAYLHAPCPG